MIPSVNGKTRVGRDRRGNTRVYTSTEYHRKQQQGILDLSQQLLAINTERHRAGLPQWVPRPTDRYLLCFSFDFEQELRADADNPLKPTTDLLQHAGILYNDNRVFQGFFEKNPNIPYPRAVITIYRFSKAIYTKVPLRELVEGWLANQSYTIERFS